MDLAALPSLFGTYQGEVKTLADRNRIYGGGYTGGNKENQGNPSGLIKASQKAGGQGLIFVAMNYRLGALGFLAGPTLQGSGGVSNAALYDQRLAIEWVAKYIHLFGGDPGRVTVMGESAGGKSTDPSPYQLLTDRIGGSLEHQITGRKVLLSQRSLFADNF